MELKDIMAAVQAVADKKDATADELAQVKTQLEDFVSKSALTELEQKTVGLEAQVKEQVDELKEQLMDMEAKGLFTMEPQTKTFDLNAELKSRLANPAMAQKDIMNTQNQESAGVTIRTQYGAGIIKALRDRSTFLARCGRHSVPNEDFKRMVRIKDATVRWAGENVAGAPTANTGVTGYAEVTGTFGKVEAYPAFTDEMLHDSEFDLMAEVEHSVADEVADTIAAAMLRGDGVKKPKGLLACVDGADHEKFDVIEIGAAGKLGTSEKAIEQLRAVIRALPAGYRGKAELLMNEETRDLWAALLDANKRSFINYDITDAPEGTLLGYRIVIEHGLEKGEMLFGDVERAFTMLDVQGMKVMPNPYAVPGVMQVYHAIRVGAIVNDVKALKIVKIKA